MTALLLDSHVLLWALDDSPRLGRHTRRRLLEPDTTVLVSAASTWELRIKHRLGKIDLPDDLERHVEEAGFVELPVRHRHTSALLAPVELPHRDPFDRMLLVQARTDKLTFLTADRVLLDQGLEFVVDAAQ